MTLPSVPTYASLGLLRVAVVAPELRVADVAFNTGAILASLREAADRGCRLALFPELCITGYSCADLFYQPLLLRRACDALGPICEAAEHAEIAVAVGLPLEVAGRLYNCMALVAGGLVLGAVPKTHLPNTREFYEARWFTPGSMAAADVVMLAGRSAPFGPDLLFAAGNFPGLIIGMEVCEDLWAVAPPSSVLALGGASVLLNGSASNELLGKAEYRRNLVAQQSARCLAAYLYAGAGPNESTTDLVWSGHCLIAENGTVMAETERFRFDTQMAVADVDVQQLIGERGRSSAFASAVPDACLRVVDFDLPGGLRASSQGDLARPQLNRLPFVPADPEHRARHCTEIFAIQAAGLAKRLRHTGCRRVTIGVSGGLDSTLALLVCAKAFDLVGLPRAGIIAVTMPGFGTTERTRANAEKLARALGASLRVIPIVEAVREHFRAIGHDENAHDLTYENAQARERTQVLMDVGNQVGGFVVGTGDLSELALGWATFNGDHMSMYHVLAGVPKTLVRTMVAWAAEAEFSGETSDVLRDIGATPISPELLPPGESGLPVQETEGVIGPYELHDFFLYYTVRHAFPPRKVFWLAQQVFSGEYSGDEILNWLAEFYRRFFSQQYKRSAMPDGPKVGSVSLSPRGDWRMPSDASPELWLAEVEALRSS